MIILGLIEMRPFDGTDPFVCLRVSNETGVFDLPITREQLDIIVANLPESHESASEEDSVATAPSRTHKEYAEPHAENVFSVGAQYEEDFDDL